MPRPKYQENAIYSAIFGLVIERETRPEKPPITINEICIRLSDIAQRKNKERYFRSVALSGLPDRKEWYSITSFTSQNIHAKIFTLSRRYLNIGLYRKAGKLGRPSHQMKVQSWLKANKVLWAYLSQIEDWDHYTLSDIFGAFEFGKYLFLREYRLRTWQSGDEAKEESWRLIETEMRKALSGRVEIVPWLVSQAQRAWEDIYLPERKSKLYAGSILRDIGELPPDRAKHELEDWRSKGGKIHPRLLRKYEGHVSIAEETGFYWWRAKEKTKAFVERILSD